MFSKINRTLLEMEFGIVFIGILCQLVGALIVERQLFYAASLWFGIVLAMVSAVHMYRSLNRALENEETARKRIFRAYLFRYVLLVVILFMIMTTEVLNPLVVFMAYMSLKVTALLQPITHKICSKLEKSKKKGGE